MTIQEFSHKYNFKHTDKAIASKVYATTEMTEEKWVEKLKNEFVFDSSILNKNQIIVVKTNPVESEKVNETIEDETKDTDSENTEDSNDESDSNVETIKPVITKEEKLAKIKSKTSHKK